MFGIISNQHFWFKAIANALKKAKYWIEILPNTPSPPYYLGWHIMALIMVIGHTPFVLLLVCCLFAISDLWDVTCDSAGTHVEMHIMH